MTEPSGVHSRPLCPDELLSIALEEQQRARCMMAGLGPCPIVLSGATTQLGSFSVDRVNGGIEIRISRHIGDPAQVRETARHELAHQAAWERYSYLGHGPLWKNLAVFLGCAPVSCSTESFAADAARARQRYVVTCSSCGNSSTRQKRSRLVAKPWRYVCVLCGGRLRVVDLTARGKATGPSAQP